MQTASSRIWTQVAVSLSYESNHYTMKTSYILVCLYLSVWSIFVVVTHIDVCARSNECTCVCVCFKKVPLSTCTYAFGLVQKNVGLEKKGKFIKCFRRFIDFYLFINPSRGQEREREREKERMHQKIIMLLRLLLNMWAYYMYYNY